MRRLKNRRGIALVLMVFMLSVLIGAAALAVDIGRMRVYRTELSTGTDAGALAAVWNILVKQDASWPDSAVTAAQYYAGRHGIGPDTIQVNAGDVQFGHWTLPSAALGSCTAVPGAAGTCWQAAPVSDTNGVMVVSQTRTAATQNYTFGRFFGINSHTTRDTAIAVMGYVGVTSCVRPIALPYQALLDQLYPPAGSQTIATHPKLTDDDVTKLQNAGLADTVSLKLGSDSQQGNFYIVNLGPYADVNGNLYSPSPNFGGLNIFSDRFGGDCSHSPWSIGPGDWLQGKTGDADGPTRSGYGELCGINVGGNGSFPCPTQDSIKIAVWGTENDSFCTPRCFQVMFIGIFVVVDFVKTAGVNAYEGVVGYFAAMPSQGALTNVPTPIRKIQLVY